MKTASPLSAHRSAECLDMDGDEIERRLGYSDSRLFVGATTVKKPSNSSRPAAAPKQRIITQTKSRRELMRQVSGLGMEDPVFHDTGGVEIPDHPSNLFDDMSLGDMPPDMRDLVSVASDPTAGGDHGIDIGAFQASLGDLHMSVSEFSAVELALPRSCPQSPVPKSIETSTSGTSVEEWQRRSRSKSPYQRPTRKGDRFRRQQELNASARTLQSLDIERDVFHPQRADEDPLHHSNGRFKTSEDSAQVVLEAALAMQRSGRANQELILAAMSQSLNELNCSAEDLKGAPRRHVERRSSSQAAVPDYEAPSPGSMESGRGRLSVKARQLPTIGGLFPDSPVVVKRKVVRRSRRARIPPASAGLLDSHSGHNNNNNQPVSILRNKQAPSSESPRPRSFSGDQSSSSPRWLTARTKSADDLDPAAPTTERLQV